MAAGTFRPALLASAAARARARRVVDFRYAMPPALVAGYDLPGLTTYIDADGLVRYQPHTLYQNSDDLESAFWVDRGGLVSAAPNTTTPCVDGSRCTTLTFAAGEGYSFLRRSYVGVAGQRYTQSIRVHSSSTHRYISLRCLHGSGAVSFPTYDLVAKVWSSSGSGYPQGAVSMSAKDIGGGWVRLAVTQTLDIAETRYFSIGAALSGGGNEYINNPTSSTLIVQRFRVQIGEDSGADDDALLLTTTAARHLPALFDSGRRGLRLEGPQTNPIPKTSELDNVLAWNAPSGATVQANVSTAPDGSLTADKLVEDTSNGIHYARSVNYSITAGSLNTFTYSMKADGRSKVRLFLANTASNSGVYYDYTLSGAGSFAFGALVGTGSGAAASIQARANGWYDVTISGVVDSSSTSAGVFFYLVHETLGASYLGNGSSGALAWGHQPEAGAVSSSRIINNTTAAMLRPGAQQVISGAEFSRLFPAARTRGPELVANGGFDSTSGWLLSSGATDMEISGGALRSLVSASKWAHSDASNLTAGTRYIATWEHLTAGDVPAAATRVIAGYPGINFCDSNYTTGVGAKSLLFAAPVSGKFGLFTFSAGLNIDNVSLRELDTSVPSLQAFTLFITLADRPRPFAGAAGNMTFFALNGSGTYSPGNGFLVRSNGVTFVAGGAASAATSGSVAVDGKNVVAVAVDVANKRVALSANGEAAAVITNLDYTGIGSNVAQLRGIDSSALLGDGVATHQTIEVLPLMSDAALQAECARRFALP